MDRVSSLLERARAATSLDDFGDESFREGLEILVACADTQAGLHEQGRAAFDHQVVDLLSRRLEVEHWYRMHPEIDEQEIVAPLIGLGLPRTGSTALYCLLAEDPAVRCIRTWESQAPCPPPETATQHTDPRIAEAAQRQAFQDQMLPRLRAMLPLSPTAPMECQNFMGYDFKSMVFGAMAKLPDYSEWLNYKADLVPTYRYVKRVLKLLQWRCPPRRWRLKNPNHTLYITALDKVFPDARYWMTHRDVADVIPSVTELYCSLAAGLTDQVDIPYTAEFCQAWTELGMRRLIAFRDAGRDSRFFDIYFAPFQRDPFPDLENLYRFIGEPFTDEARRRMQAWRDNSPREKLEYDPAAFGIDLGRVRDRFRFYSDRFHLADHA
ncbi:MAG TPA: sulfotransferase [Caulobacteraceae bacterium]|nr:sulfotransferase [Caulobacteraceae bacterium]